MFGDNLISHLITLKCQKKGDRKYPKKMILAIADQKSSDLLLKQMRIFSIEAGKKLSREYFRSDSIHVYLNKGEICITHLLKTIL